MGRQTGDLLYLFNLEERIPVSLLAKTSCFY
jgi:hypothetical protein